MKAGPLIELDPKLFEVKGCDEANGWYVIEKDMVSAVAKFEKITGRKAATAEQVYSW